MRDRLLSGASRDRAVTNEIAKTRRVSANRSVEWREGGPAKLLNYIIYFTPTNAGRSSPPLFIFNEKSTGYAFSDRPECCFRRRGVGFPDGTSIAACETNDGDRQGKGRFIDRYLFGCWATTKRECAPDLTVLTSPNLCAASSTVSVSNSASARSVYPSLLVT